MSSHPLSGHELAEKLSSRRPVMKVLHIRITDGAVATHGVLEAGIVILRKPFPRAQLQQNVAQILGKDTGKGETEENAQHAESRE